MPNPEPILDFLRRFDLPEDVFADLCGITVDDLHALTECTALDPPPRIQAIVRLLKAAGVHKSQAVLSGYDARRPESEWRRIPGFPAYEASACGNIRRIRASNHGLRVLKKMVRPDGYLKVTLYDEDGTKVPVGVHRAVCLAWHGEPVGARRYACHKNGDPKDNRQENLYWGTPAENARDTVRHGRCHGARPVHLVQSPYKRTNARLVRIAFEEGIISHKQYLVEIDALHAVRSKG